MKTQTAPFQEITIAELTRQKDAICVNESKIEEKWYHNLKYLFIGIAFGIVFVKAEIISWFRI